MSGRGRRRRGRIKRETSELRSMTMEKKWREHGRLEFFILLFFLLESSTASGLEFSFTKHVNSFRLARIQRHLNKINKPAVRTIQSMDGDIIDCVQKHNQPSLDPPLLKNHKIQNVPPVRPKLNLQGRNYSSSGFLARGAWQTWHRTGHCPRGTVPIRRSSVNDVLRAKSIFHYGKKVFQPPSRQSRSTEAPDVVSGNGHEHAIAYTGSGEFYGAKATINVWDPSIDGSNEFSLSQMWVLSGSFDGSDLNSIEAGWQVSPELYGDSKPRLFTYWTTNSRIAIGASISPVSSDSGDQYDITILIWKDPKLGNWWLSFGENNLVGYWPAELFTHLADHAEMVEWGGEIVNTRRSGQHTTTQMGSGRFAAEGFRHSGYFRNIEVVDGDNSLSPVGTLSTLAEDTHCYDIASASSEAWGNYFYFGGPGNNPLCP